MDRFIRLVASRLLSVQPLAVGAALGICSGCGSLGDSVSSMLVRGGDLHVISLHFFGDPEALADRRTVEVVDQDGGWITIRRAPLVSSSSFREMKTVETPKGETQLSASLDTHGRMLWLQARAEYNGRRVAVVVDGVCRGSLRIPTAGGERKSLLLPGPWSAEEARAIARAAPANYRALNGR